MRIQTGKEYLGSATFGPIALVSYSEYYFAFAMHAKLDGHTLWATVKACGSLFVCVFVKFSCTYNLRFVEFSEILLPRYLIVRKAFSSRDV